MMVPVPSIEWPAEFLEAGPAEDATIILTAGAKIGEIAFNVVALRMRAGLRTPDYKEGVAASAYETAMDSMLDDVEDLVDSSDPELMLLNGAQYLLWMVPAAHT